MNKKAFIQWLMFLCLLLQGTILMGGSDPDSGKTRVPTINSHTFIPVDKEFNPFVSSRLKILVGIAQTQPFEIASLEIGGKEIFSLEGKLFFTNANIDYHQKIKDWLAIYFNYSLSARYGTEISSLYAEGLNTITGLELGWLIKIISREKHLLSAKFEIADYNANFINLSRVFLNLVEDTVIAVSENIPALFGSTGIKYAYAPNDLFGFIVTGETAFGESFSRGKSQLYYQLGVLADLNLYHRTGVPLGIAIKNITTNFPTQNSINNNVINFSGIKFAYTGARDFVIGTEASWSKLPTRSKGSLGTMLISLQLHLYF